MASDRRYKESLDILKAMAFLDGRKQVAEDDLLVYQHILWHDPSQAGEVAKLVFSVAEPLLVAVTEIEDGALDAVKEVRQVLANGSITGAEESQKLLESISRLKEAKQKLGQLAEQVAGSTRAEERIGEVAKRIKGWQSEAMKALGV